MKNIYIETYGCQMNEYDTELIQTILIESGFTIVNGVKNADIVMLNTCSVRENANNKIFNRIHVLKKQAKPRSVKIGVLGCMATNFKESLLNDRRLHIDFIAGPDSYKQLPQLILESNGFDVTLSEFETYADITPTRRTSVNAWVAIMRGCNNFCSYCIVPYTRGRERSRSMDDILTEIQTLIRQGYTQVTLLGQNVNSYHHEHYTFTDLLQKISDLKGLKRIRFMSPHPKDFPIQLLHLMKERPNICNQIHLPLQSGSTAILKKMNRTYTQSQYLELAAACQSILPNVALSTDIIIGFPTETDADFEDTLKVVKTVRFDSAFIFKYSPRDLTYAARHFIAAVPESTQKARSITINAIQKEISIAINQSQINETQIILLEQKGTKKNTAEYQGRNEANKPVIIAKISGAIGDYIPVKIISASANVLKGIAPS